MKLKIDGIECKFEIGDAMDGWTKVFRMGETMTGRVARVSCHTVPTYIIENGGACFTGGHKYEFKRDLLQ